MQCAYHVPLLRELVLNAKDEIIEVQVEVEDDDVIDTEVPDSCESEAKLNSNATEGQTINSSELQDSSAAGTESVAAEPKKS